MQGYDAGCFYFFLFSQREVINPLLYGAEYSYQFWIKELQQAFKYSARPDRVEDGVKVVCYHVLPSLSEETAHSIVYHHLSQQSSCIKTAQRSFSWIYTIGWAVYSESACSIQAIGNIAQKELKRINKDDCKEYGHDAPLQFFVLPVARLPFSGSLLPSVFWALLPDPLAHWFHGLPLTLMWGYYALIWTALSK